MAGLVLARIASSLNGDWFGAHLALIPLLPSKNWSCKLATLEREILLPAGAALFTDRGSGKLVEVPNVENACWAVFRITKNAQWGYFFCAAQVRDRYSALADAGSVPGPAETVPPWAPLRASGQYFYPHYTSGPDAKPASFA